MGAMIDQKKAAQTREAPPLWELEIHLAELTSKQTAIPRERIRSDSRLLEDLHIDSLDMVELILGFRCIGIPADLQTEAPALS
jgi:hypothetical protein